VFYKFIVEIDGVVKLSTDVSKLLSTTKVLPVDVFEDVLDSATKIGYVDIEVECDETTLICRCTWNDAQNIVQTVVFEVYRTNMFGKQLINTQETTSASGSMVYTITEDISGNTYEAVAHIHTNTEYSWYNSVARAIMKFPANLSAWGGIASLFPAMLLMISVIFALMSTVGAVGVILGSILAIVSMSMIGLLSFSWANIVILIVLGGILIVKLRQ